MSLLKGCSELQEARALVLELLAPGTPVPSAAMGRSDLTGGALSSPQSVVPEIHEPERDVISSMPAAMYPTPAAQLDEDQFTPSAGAPPLAFEQQGERVGDSVAILSDGERLEQVLATLCRCAGLEGALVADGSGRLLAAHNRPVPIDNLAAFTSSLDEAIEKANRLLGRSAMDFLSLDIDQRHKYVVKRFFADARPHYLVGVTAQVVDARHDLENCVEQVLAVLGHPTPTSA